MSPRDAAVTWLARKSIASRTNVLSIQRLPSLADLLYSRLLTWLSDSPVPAPMQDVTFFFLLSISAIGLTDKDGNKICFHSTRNSYISFLANSQTPAKVVQKLARHSDPRLTFNIYARTLEKAEQKALDFLPNFGDFVLSTCLDKVCRKQEISVDNRRQKNSQDAVRTAILAEKRIPPRGVEPLSPG